MSLGERGCEVWALAPPKGSRKAEFSWVKKIWRHHFLRKPLHRAMYLVLLPWTKLHRSFYFIFWWCMGSVVAACGISCPADCGISVSLPGTEPTSPALQGRFLTTGPPGKSQGGIIGKQRRLWAFKDLCCNTQNYHFKRKRYWKVKRGNSTEYSKIFSEFRRRQ